MPELPDLVYFRRYVDEHALDQRIRAVHVHDADRFFKNTSETTVRRHLEGRKLLSTERHGKYLLCEIEDDGWLVLHFGMTGQPVYDCDEERPEYTKLDLEFTNGCHLAYTNVRKLGEIGLVDGLDELIEQHDLGPDALSDEFDRGTFHELLADRRGMLKTRLMDQSLLAGIGNIYSDEILFQAKLHPRVTVDDLDDETIDSLYDTIREVLTVCGEHFPDLDQLEDSYLVAHRLDGENGTCPRCDTPIERLDVSGRTAQYCPNCQPPPG